VYAGFLDDTGGSSRVITADRGDAGRRIDLVLRRHLTDVESATRTRVQSWIAGGRVTINGRLVQRVATRAAAGDTVAVALPPACPRPPMGAEDLPIAVLFEDEHLLVLDKPPGVVVHPTYGHSAGTIMNALLWHARSWDAAERPSIVGRLDKHTSGIVVVAKTAAIHAAMQRAWSGSSSRKDYLALVYGRVNAARGRIDLPLHRDPGDRRRVIVAARAGAPSVTLFERLGRAAAPRVGLSLLRCRLVTGRTHQIRVHLAARGWPIVGDPVYGKQGWKEITDKRLAEALRALPRQALHAWRLEVPHPATGRTLRVEAPVPADLSVPMALSGLDKRIPSGNPEPRTD
jgi:23S rRNA pseudouridine1911/1915/1917 synthase